MTDQAPRPAALVTGASAGFGAAFARALAKRGETVILTARRADRLEALATELGGAAHVLPADLADPAAPDALMAAIAARGLRVDTLINNAGYGLVGRFDNLDRDGQLGMIDVNVRALTALAYAVLPGMKAAGRGRILNIASTAAFQPGPGFGVYFATKAYVLSLSEALHQELKGSGIAVSTLCPGPARTEFGAVAGVTSQAFDRFAMDAESVVAAGLTGLDRGQAVIVPGFANKVTAQSSRILPRALMRRIVARLKL